jgi:magnesium transporter
MYKFYKNKLNGIEEIDVDEIEKGSWINVVAPSPEELLELQELTGVSRDFLTAALDDEEKSRMEIDDNQLLVLIDIPLLRSTNDYDTIPLGIITTKEYTITVCLEVNAVLADIARPDQKVIKTFKRTRFLFQILFRSATLYLRYIRNINSRTDELEMHLRKSMDNKELLDLLDVQKSFTFFSASLRSNYVVTEKLLRLRTSKQAMQLVKLYEEDEDLLDDVIIEYKQAIEMVEMYTAILNSMMGVFASIINNNMNLVMKFLAGMTIVLAIPTLLSGLWGMNVPVPFTDNPYGFFIVAASATIIASVFAYVLWREKMF